MSARSLSLAASLLIGIGVLSGCSATVALDPAPHAEDPLCAEVSVRLPDRIGDQDRRWTDAQATGAWGDPTTVIVSCGVEPPGPTTLPCQSVDGVDWIIEDEGDYRFRVTTFGRTPAVQVYLDTTTDGVSSRDTLEALSAGVSRLPVDGACTARPGTDEPAE